MQWVVIQSSFFVFNGIGIQSEVTSQAIEVSFHVFIGLKDAEEGDKDGGCEKRWDEGSERKPKEVGVVWCWRDKVPDGICGRENNQVGAKIKATA